MPRGKKTHDNVARDIGDSPRSTSLGNKLVWVNIRLEAEDIAFLAESELTLHQLSASLIDLVSDGIGVSVKFVDGGKSVCCTLIGSDMEDGGLPCGISAFGSSSRNAILACLYKYSNGLGGTFDGGRKRSSNNQPSDFR